MRSIANIAIVALLWLGGSIFLWWLSDLAYEVHWLLGLPVRISAILSSLFLVLAAIGLLVLAVKSKLGLSHNDD